MLQVCNCGSCGKFFSLAGAKEVTRTLYNIKIKEKLCPYCGSEEWGPADQDKFLDRYLKFADNGYRV